MTKLFAKCQNCKHRRLLIKQREYKVPQSKQTMTSQSELCGVCYRGIKKMIKSF